MAHMYFNKVLKLRKVNNISVPKHGVNKNNECTEPADLSRVKDLDSLKVQGFLIGARVLPKSVQTKWFLPTLLRTFSQK